MSSASLRKPSFLRKHYVKIMIGFLAVLLLAGCGEGGSPKGRKASEPDRDGLTKKKQEIVYFSEKIEFNLPENMGLQRFLTEKGTIFGVDEKGETWGFPEFPEGMSLENVIEFLADSDCFFCVKNNAMDSIWIYDREGKEKGKIDCKGSRVLSLGGGNYVLCEAEGNGSRQTVERLDADKKELTEVLQELPQDTRSLLKLGSDGENLYLRTAEEVVWYSFADRAFTPIFAWSDVGIVGGEVLDAWKMGENYFAAVWDIDLKKIVYYKIIPGKQEKGRQNKKQLVIVALDGDSNLQTMVANFNKSQDEYSLKVQKLSDDGNLMNINDITARLNASLLTEDAPDMLWLQNISYREALAAGGYLENLRDYLKKSESLSEDDFYPEVLNYGSYGDILYTIPYQFSLRTLAVPQESWNRGKGWTYPEMVEYLRGLEEYRPFGQFFFMRMWLLNENLEYFFDEDKKEAYFDGEDFRQLLEYMKDCQDRENETAEEEREFHVKCLDIHSIQYFFEFEREVEGKVTYVGFPTREGKAKVNMVGNMEAAILRSSPNKDGAWKFMESYLSAYPDKNMNPQYALWSNRQTMQKMIASELPLFGKNKVETKDEAGNVIWTDYSEHNLGPEGVAAFEEMLTDVGKRPANAAAVKQIVWEETASYFAGQKSVSEVTQIIQNRVSLLLKEE